MPLTNLAADAVADAICTALGVSDTASKAKYKTIYETLYMALLADITVTLAAGSVVTTGSAATQAGPPAPVPLVVT